MGAERQLIRDVCRGDDPAMRDLESRFPWPEFDVRAPDGSDEHSAAGGRERSGRAAAQRRPWRGEHRFADRPGIARVDIASCASGKTGCTVRSEVYTTADGGKSWALD